MKVYFGILKENVIYNNIISQLLSSEIIVLHYYPKFNIVKFKTNKEVTDINFDFFIGIEEEKDSFSIQ